MRTSAGRRGVSAIFGPIADAVVFIVALGAGMPMGAAHIASFAVYVVVNYFANVHGAAGTAGVGGAAGAGGTDEPRASGAAGVAGVAHGRTPRLYWHLLVASLVALYLRGGVLALLTSVWGWPAQLSIVFAIGATLLVTRVGYSLSLSSDRWQFGSGLQWRALAMAFVGGAFLLRLIYSGQLELMPEETYYWNYSQHLDIGYLDHPPMVAWLIRLGTAICGNTAFGVRLGALFCGAIASFFVYRLTRDLFDEASALVALVLMQVLPFFFFAGILMTPDVPLTAAWAASLYYLERALVAERPAAWWGVGVCLGLGMLSKYTIGMLAPAMLIFMVFDVRSRRWLWNWRPYVAAVLALAIFSPVIVWNATHEWASFAFQTSRRLAEAPKFSLHKLIASALVLLTPAGLVALPGALRGWGGTASARVSGAGGDAAAAGAAGVGDASRRRWRFLQLAVLTPLAVFTAFSLRHDVKFDWTGALWIAAVPALAFSIVAVDAVVSGARAWARSAWVPTLCVLLLIFGAFFHYLTLGLPGVGYGEHMELVPVGWRSLGEQVTALKDDIRAMTGAEPLVVGMDRYMIASELAFYSPDIKRSVHGTTSEHLFGANGLMYERWFPAGQQEGRTLLLIAWQARDIADARIAPYANRLDAIKEGVLTHNGRMIRRYYSRVAYGYHGGGAASAGAALGAPVAADSPTPAAPAGAGALAAISTPPATSEEKVLNVYNWYDYIKPELVREFEAQSGIKVHYDVFDSNNTLETKLLAGHSGYDVVFPSSAYLERLIPAGVFRPLDKSKLPNLANLDPVITRRLAVGDPGNAHAVDYAWGITGFAYDAAKIRARMPQAPVDSWAMLFDPKVAARFADCGIGLYESPNVIVPSVLIWLGQPPNSEDPRNLQRAQDALLAIRPYIRKISSGSLVDDLASGELCLVIASNGDAMQAQERTRIAANGEEVRYAIPREGAVMWFDVAAILADAPHPDNAHRFINFLMDARVAAENSNTIRFPNGNLASQAALQAEFTNAAIFPVGELAGRLFPERPKSEQYVRLLTRAWTRFKTGR